MRFQKFSFGSIRIDGTTYEHDVVIDRGEVRKRKKKPSKTFRDTFGHTPISPKEAIPWKCRQLLIGTGTGALPVMDEVKQEAKRWIRNRGIRPEGPQQLDHPGWRAPADRHARRGAHAAIG